MLAALLWFYRGVHALLALLYQTFDSPLFLHPLKSQVENIDAPHWRSVVVGLHAILHLPGISITGTIIITDTIQQVAQNQNSTDSDASLPGDSFIIAQGLSAQVALPSGP